MLSCVDDRIRYLWLSVSVHTMKIKGVQCCLDSTDFENFFLLVELFLSGNQQGSADTILYWYCNKIAVLYVKLFKAFVNFTV